MCRIAACQGVEDAPAFLIKALRRLEYGGYDSAGVAVQSNRHIELRKKRGNVADLEELLNHEPIAGVTGIGHTRWATNGAPSDHNAHPHLSFNKRVAVVHNGIIISACEQRLRAELQKEGVSFVSDTDTEVIANVIERELARGANSLEDAVAQATDQLEGAYALAVIGADYPDEVIGVCKSSSLWLGINSKALFLASDRTAFPGYASHEMQLKEGDIVVLKNGQYHFTRSAHKGEERSLQPSTMSPEEVEKGGYPDFLLKEIMEQGVSLQTVLAGRLLPGKERVVRLGGIERLEKRIAEARRIVLTACGTAYHAALLGKLYIEELAGIPVEVQYAHEFRTSVLDSQDVLIAVSQSGETMDTISAVRKAREKDVLCLGINNRYDSTLAREVDAGVYLHAGPETSVASTKAFTAQVVVLLLFAMRMAQVRGRDSLLSFSHLMTNLGYLPNTITQALGLHDQVKKIAQEIAHAKTILFLGRGYAVPIACEGALKMEEISYKNVKGHPGGELMHGCLAMVEEGTPVIAMIGEDEHTEKMISSMQKVRSRGGRLIVLRCGAVKLPKDLASTVIRLPYTPSPELFPLIAVVPLQLLAREVAVLLGNDVDRPRNLAKSVTVE